MLYELSELTTKGGSKSSSTPTSLSHEKKIKVKITNPSEIDFIALPIHHDLKAKNRSILPISLLNNQAYFSLNELLTMTHIQSLSGCNKGVFLIY
jgi:hypothetical protein